MSFRCNLRCTCKSPMHFSKQESPEKMEVSLLVCQEALFSGTPEWRTSILFLEPIKMSTELCHRVLRATTGQISSVRATSNCCVTAQQAPFRGAARCRKTRSTARSSHEHPARKQSGPTSLRDSQHAFWIYAEARLIKWCKQVIKWECPGS